MIKFDELEAWQAEKPDSREVTVKIRNLRGKREVDVTVYDSTLMEAQVNITSVSDIDLEGRHAAKEREEFQRLSQKFAAA